MTNDEWRMANGEWRMANGEWRMANDEWRMTNGEWRMANDEWRMANGEWRMSNVELRSGQWAVVALCLAAFALRLGPLWANRFHPDEALYASWGLLIRTGRDVWLSQQSADKPPLQFYLMAVSFHYLWRSEVAARLPGLIGGMLSIPLVYQIPALKSQTARWTTAALVAFSPYAILYSPTAFLDPLMVMFALAACAAASRGRAGWAGTWLGLSIATKLTGALFLPVVMMSGKGKVEGGRWKVASGKWKVPSTFYFLLSTSAVLVLVVLWDRLKGGVPFWVQQAANYGEIGLVAPNELVPRLFEWLEFFPYLFGWPALGALAVLGVTYCVLRIACCVLRIPPSTFYLPPSTFYLPPSTFYLPLFYLAVHWLLTFQVWDRYLLGLVPLLALWAGHLVSRITHYVLRITYCVLLVLVLLPAALVAARSGYPIGGDHGAYDGIEQVADYLRAQPEGTVVYDHWLTWEFEYYLWDAQVYRAYFPSPDFLRDDLRAFGNASPRYLAIPAHESAQPVLEAIGAAGFRASPVLTTTNRRGELTFTVYQIVP